jgi:hypothetical protein
VFHQLHRLVRLARFYQIGADLTIIPRKPAEIDWPKGSAKNFCKKKFATASHSRECRNQAIELRKMWD